MSRACPGNRGWMPPGPCIKSWGAGSRPARYSEIGRPGRLHRSDGGIVPVGPLGHLCLGVDAQPFSPAGPNRERTPGPQHAAPDDRVSNQLQPAGRKGLRMAADDRVLGNGDFVEQIWAESAELEKETLRRRGPGMDLEAPAREIATDQGITETELRSGSRKRKVSEARRAFSRIASSEMGFPAATVARFLGVSTSAVVRAARYRIIG